VNFVILSGLLGAPDNRTKPFYFVVRKSRAAW
jgi:hypothetical protein